MRVYRHPHSINTYYYDYYSRAQREKQESMPFGSLAELAAGVGLEQVQPAAAAAGQAYSRGLARHLVVVPLRV